MKDIATSAGTPQPIGQPVGSASAAAQLATSGRPDRPWYRRPLVIRLVAGLLILAVWQLVVDVWAQDYVARPTGVIRVIPSVLTEKLFLSDIVTTLAAVIEGLAIAVVLGTAIGLVVGRLPDAQRILGMYVNGVYALPIIAVVPLLTVWFGYTSKARLVVIILEATLPLIYNVAEGARAVPRVYLDVTRIHGAPWWRVWFGVALPASTPYVLAGMDLAIGRALIGAVVAEFIAAIDGLGYYILFNVNSFQENRAIVALIVLALAAILLRAAVNFVVRRGFSWYLAGMREELR
jgi:ABC-type nitrate/sulfonate/bicarbonate transport system permease component